jgi:uncharacterized protein (TIGR02996 family)
LREPNVKERVLTFEQREITIGAPGSGADLILADSSIGSALSARMLRQDGELLLLNYSAAAPVTVNGHGINRLAVVHGDVVKTGQVELVIVSETKLDPREQALVDDIVADPSDEMSRVVYADWLEENGFADRAQFLRLDAAVDKALKGSWNITIREDVALLSALGRNLPPAWLALMKRKPKSPVR